MNDIELVRKVGIPAEYSSMLKKIESSLPAIHVVTSNFHKTQSQFMDNVLTLSHYTPLRNARQALAEIKKTEMAMREAYVICYKKEAELKIAKRNFELEEDTLKKDLINADILGLTNSLAAIRDNICGAVRKLANYTEKYNEILISSGHPDGFTEEEFEAEEERYHITRAFDQAMTAARSRGGLIDEGNLIYLTQIGINCMSAQMAVSRYLGREAKLVSDGHEPTHEMYVAFLNEMADKYAGCSTKATKLKGIDGYTTKSALLELSSDSE
jgi:hypothetical protein